MKSTSTLPAVAFATWAFCSATSSQMIVSPMAEAGPQWGCSMSPRLEPDQPIVEFDEETLAAADRFLQVRVPGSEVRARTDRLMNELTWHRGLREAARLAQKTDKPILWIQVLGSLRGLT